MAHLNWVSCALLFINSVSWTRCRRSENIKCDICKRRGGRGGWRWSGDLSAPRAVGWEDGREGTSWSLKCCVWTLSSLSSEEVATRHPLLASHTLLTVAGQVGTDTVSTRDSPPLPVPDALNVVDTALRSQPSGPQKPQTLSSY